MNACRLPQWTPGSLRAYGPLELSPAAGVLNYGQVREGIASELARPPSADSLWRLQGIFEGLKAYRTTKGRVVLFRPQEVRLLPARCSLPQCNCLLTLFAFPPPRRTPPAAPRALSA